MPPSPRQARRRPPARRSPATSRARGAARRRGASRRRHRDPLRSHRLLRGTARRCPGAQLARARHGCSERLQASGSRPHFVHVSTAYVADRDAGVVHEDGLPHHARRRPSTPRRCSTRPASGAREAERESREPPERRRRFAKAASKDAARRPGLDAAARAEDLRRRWVQQRLSVAGRAQAAGGRLARHLRLLEGARRTAAARALGARRRSSARRSSSRRWSGRSRAGWTASRSPTR